MNLTDGIWTGTHTEDDVSSLFQMLLSPSNFEKFHNGCILEPFSRFDDLKREKRAFYRAEIYELNVEQKNLSFRLRYLNRSIGERTYEGVLSEGEIRGTWTDSTNSGVWFAVPGRRSGEQEQESLLLSCLIPEWLAEPNLTKIVGSESGVDLFGYPEDLINKFRKLIKRPILILYSGGSIDLQSYTNKIKSAIDSGVLIEPERENALKAAGLSQFELPMIYSWLTECGYTPLCLSYENIDYMPHGLRSLQVADEIWWDVLKFLTRGSSAIFIQGLEAFRSEAKEIQYIGLRKELREKTLLGLEDDEIVCVWLPAVLPASTGGRSTVCPRESWKWWEIQAALRWICDHKASHNLTDTELTHFHEWSVATQYEHPKD